MELTIFLLVVVGMVFQAEFLSCASHKPSTDDDCLSSNIMCYICDSKSDPNCADPFDSSSLDATNYNYYPNDYTSLSPNELTQAHQPSPDTQVGHTINSYSNNNNISATTPSDVRRQQFGNWSYPYPPPPLLQQQLQPKKMPDASPCHGCCVKITSKLPDGTPFTKRTCTSNIQINYFMVGLVCMKESGDRGKMCFCATDYCNAARAKFAYSANYYVIVLVATMIFSMAFVTNNRITLHAPN